MVDRKKYRRANRMRADRQVDSNIDKDDPMRKK